MITVMFTCHQCGLSKIPVQVPAREANEPLPNWMDLVVGPAIHQEHAMRQADRKGVRSMCKNTTFDIYLPAPSEARWIGEDIPNPPKKEGEVNGSSA